LDRPLTLLIGLAAASIPASAPAQTWPATVAAGARQMAPRPPSPTLTIERNIIVLRPPGTAPTQPGPARRTAIVVRTPPQVRDVPEVEVRPKEAWLDDQGLRLTPTRVAFKRRF
jgi:hypothetical protein